jgi:hypothetical protein
VLEQAMDNASKAKTTKKAAVGKKTRRRKMFIIQGGRARSRQTFHTRLSRFVKHGGGVEADFKVQAPKASALEITLLRSDVLGKFASQWSRKNQLTNDFEVDDIEHDSQGIPRFHRTKGEIWGHQT